MRNRARKRGNALKHGVFSGTLILSWEKREEFEKLCAALVEEWQPDGPTEQEAVLSIAMGVWRKRRLARFMNSQLQRCRLDPNHTAYDEAHALRVFLTRMASEPDQFDSWFRALAPLHVEHLERKCPRKNFQSTSEWAAAVQDEVRSALLPRASEYDGDIAVMIIRDSGFFVEEPFKFELGMDERIDAMIDRATKRLIRIKAMKQMLSMSSSEVSHQSKKIPGNGSTQSVPEQQGPQ